MDVKAEYVNYKQTGYFTNIITDYLEQDEKVKPFFEYAPDLEGIKKAIRERVGFKTDRNKLVGHLSDQYKNISTSKKVEQNIARLSEEHTFTVCTAHQPNILTGPLYFIYKIIHTIKLADQLCLALPEYHFVPVFYMGNEDADLEELGHIYLNGQKYDWKTKQTGAVGKMLVDEQLIKLISAVGKQISVYDCGKEILETVKEWYKAGESIEHATLGFVNALFAEYGLVILIPDGDLLKSSMLSVFKEELLNHTSDDLISRTNKKLLPFYKPQASSREINLFYLSDNIRNRIIRQNDVYTVEHTGIRFTEDEILAELEHHPSKFSPNVILRGLYQETILPNLAFIGGGGELAYWLQLKDLFHHFEVPYPILILRNSFLILNERSAAVKNKLGLSALDIFKDSEELISEHVKRKSTTPLTLEDEKSYLDSIYNGLIERAEQVDSTLMKHVAALHHAALNKVETLEKKMLKAEKRKFTEESEQTYKLKASLFPSGSLQERKENILGPYSKYGRTIISTLYDHSKIFEQEFCVLEVLPSDQTNQ